MKIVVLFLVLCCTKVLFSQGDVHIADIKISHLIEGTLLVPDNQTSLTLAVIIQGSGPTDRDGNQPNVRNNSLKFLAEGLTKNGIATFRYDKRLVKLVRQGQLKEENISFDHFVEDAELVINHFKKDPRFNKIVILGHSQGSLVGLLVANRTQIDALVSIAGAGQEIDDVIVDQLKRQAPALADDARTSFDDMRVNGIALNFGIGLTSIFRPSIQPFMITWMKYNPQLEMAKLKIPVMIINGNQDVQVDENEALLLHQANPDAQLVILENVNHVLKEVTSGDSIENFKTYNEPNRPLSKELLDKIIEFIKGLEEK